MESITTAWRLLSPLPPVIAETIIAYATRGAERPSWSIFTQVLIKSIAAVAGNKHIDIEKVQKQMNTPAPLPSNVALSLDSYRRKRVVFDFLHDKLGEAMRPMTWESESKGVVDAEWIVHPESSDQMVVYYLHGGAFLFGSPQGSHRSLICRIAKCSGKVFGINYRLSPQNQFPAALIDAVSGYLYLIEEHGISPSKIVISGDSAGGGLTMATLLVLRDMGLPMPAGGALMSPWMDLSISSASHQTRDKTDVLPSLESLKHHPGLYYTSPTLLKHPYVSTLFHPDFEGLPPILVQVGDAERLVDEGLELCIRLLDAGVPLRLEIYGDMPHVHQTFIWLKPARVAIKRLGNFVKECCYQNGIASPGNIRAAMEAAEKQVDTPMQSKRTAFRDLIHVTPDGDILNVTDEEVKRLIGARHIKRVKKRRTKATPVVVPPQPPKESAPGTMPVFREIKSKL